MPSAATLSASLSIPRRSNQSLSSCRALTGANNVLRFPFSSFNTAVDIPSAAIIRMGGGPRTFPGGVSKWQWKRMQAKKSKQLLKARLCRERQLYEMRKRAELKAAISELERPWEVVERSPVLFSVSADEQVKVLADRFQRPTGFDMWSERDGPQLFRSPDNLPSARFFPKGVVHSVKPYRAVPGEITDGCGGSDEDGKAMRYNDWIARGAGGIGKGNRVKRVLSESNLPEKVTPDPGKSVDRDTGESLDSYYSDSGVFLAESRKEEKECHDQNHGVNRSDAEIGIAGLNKEEVEMTGEYYWDNGQSQIPHFSDSELELTDSRMEENKRAGGFRQRGGQEGRSWNRNTHQSNPALPVSGSRMEGDGMSDQFGHRISNPKPHGSDSELIVSKSRLHGHRLSGGFDRHGSRGGRRVNRRPNSVLQNQFSRVTDSEIKVDNSRMNNHVMAGGGFSRRAGHGGRGGHRSSYRSFSDSAVDDDSQGFHRMEASDITGSYVGRGSHGARVKGDSFGRRGGRGRFRGSYDSESDAGSNKAREMAGSFVRPGAGQVHKNAGSQSLLRPTTGGGRGRGADWNDRFSTER